MPRDTAHITVPGPLRGRAYAAPEVDADGESGLLGLLARAGPGARVRAWQLREPVWWGNREEAGSPTARNPRLDALIAAARRGADVQLLLDGHFDKPTGWNANRLTATLIWSVARQERLRLAARTGNPTGAGIHAKTVLVNLGPDGAWVHMGSLNGSEAASKVNREVAIHLESPRLHDFLAAVFADDWATAGHDVLFLPLAFHPRRAVE